MSAAKGSQPAAFLRIACAPRPCRLGASARACPFERNILGFQNLDGHNAALELQIQGLHAGQKRRITPAIKREMRRRSAIEPVTAANLPGKSHEAAQGKQKLRCGLRLVRSWLVLVPIMNKA